MSKPSTTIITLKDIEKVYFSDDIETHALHNVHLHIGSGEFVVITGPSGCGKSTLLSILGLLDPPTAGQYILHDREVQNLSNREYARLRNREIGFIFQAFNLINDLTVEQNVALPLTYRAAIKKPERRERVDLALHQVSMAHRKRHFPAQLSGGQQQRVAVARALVGEPSLLLADEPTGNLDSKNGDVVMRLLTDLHSRGTTICMVTHDARYANAAQRTIRLFDGQIVDESTFDKLSNHGDANIETLLAPHTVVDMQR